MPASIAAYIDFRRLLLPNFIVLPVWIAGLVWALYSGHIQDAVLGMILGFVPGFIGFQLGGLGGGDVKLMAALGTWFGVLVVPIILVGCCLGFLWSLIRLARAGQLKAWARDFGRSLFMRYVLKVRDAMVVPSLSDSPTPGFGNVLPFGPSLVIAAWTIFLFAKGGF
ncbi:MAG: A24 family peptidase [Bacillota bacterium]